MLVRNTKCLVKAGLILLPLILGACNGGGGGSSSSASTSPGTLVITNPISTTDVVLNGTHQYVVSLVNAVNLSSSVNVAVTSSDSNVAKIEVNTCATTPLNPANGTTTCSFYVAGNSTGTATINVSAVSYPVITKSLDVTQQWGTFGGGSAYANLPGGTSQLNFAGGYVYAMNYGHVAKSNGASWQDVGGGSFITDQFNQDLFMVSDESRVCISLNSSSSVAGEVKCSFNGSNWQTLSVINGSQISSISLYQGNLYALTYTTNPIIFTVETCSIDSKRLKLL